MEIIKIQFSDTFQNNIEVQGRARLLTKLAVFWWNFQKGVLGNPLISSSDTFIEIEKPKETYDITFMVLGHLHGDLYKKYKDAGDVLFDYQFSHPIQMNGAIPGKTGQLNPIMVGRDNNGEYITVKNLLKQHKTEVLTNMTMAAIHSFQRAYFYLMQYKLILGDALFKFGVNNNGDLIFVSTLFNPDTSTFFNANTFKLGKECKRIDGQSLFLKYKEPNEITKKEYKLAKKKYLQHELYINSYNHENLKETP